MGHKASSSPSSVVGKQQNGTSLGFSAIEKRRLKIFLGCLAVFLVVVFKEFGVPYIEVDCISDPIHDSTEELNRIVNTDIDVASFLQVSSSMLMDIVFLSLYTYWVFYVPTGRLPYSTILFYLIRTATQSLVIFRFPAGFYWEDPGVFTFVVPYGKQSDFFFSGHCGFLNLCALECLRIKKKGFFILVQIINAYMAIVMIVFRIHYTIDITTAIIVSHYAFLLAEGQAHHIDRFWVAVALKIKSAYLSIFGKDNKAEVKQQHQEEQSLEQQSQKATKSDSSKVKQQSPSPKKLKDSDNNRLVAATAQLPKKRKQQ